MNAYTFHITLYDLFFLGTIFIGLTFALQLWLSKSANRAANRFLALALAIVVIWIAHMLAIDIGLAAYIPFWSWMPLQFSLAFGPLIFFYVLKITRREYKFKRKDLLHFSPLLLEISAHVLQTAESIKTSAPTYETLAFQRFNPVLRLLAFISVVVYLYRCRTLIEGFYQQVKFIGSDRYRQGLGWLHRSLTVFGLLWLLWIPFTAVDYFYYNYQLGAKAYYPLYLLLVLTVIWIIARAFLKTEIRESANTVPILKPLLPVELKQKGIWLKNVVKENRYYQDPDLSLGSLAEKLGLHTHELSRVLNTVLKKSFNDFINEYRVAEVTRKMQDPAYNHMTLLGIGYDSGFNSNSAFHRIFKDKTGKSPAEYKAGVKKELPSYNLGQQPRFATVILYQETTPKWCPEKLDRNFMIKSYFKTAIRNLVQNKNYTFVNITGLVVGIAACLLIFLVLQYEQSFDNFHTKKDLLYRVVRIGRNPAGREYGTGVPFPVTRALRADYPQLENATAIFGDGGVQVLLQNEDGKTIKKFREDNVFMAEPNFFKMFDFKMVAGQPETALKEPNSLVLTETIANKYFGDWKDAVGKTLNMYRVNMKVTGILEDPPVNTDFPLSLVASYTTLEEQVRMNDWDGIDDNNYCFVQLPAGYRIADFDKKLEAFVTKHVPPEHADYNLVLKPISEMHYDARLGNFNGRTFSKELIAALDLIGLFLVVVACVNFINLSTAQAISRAREVGIRKVLGGRREQLLLQFLGETSLVCLIALLLATVIATATLPLLNGLLETQLSFNFLNNPPVISFLAMVFVTITFLSGFYPAIVLSGFNPIQALKSKVIAQSSSGISLRRGLVVLQFTIAQVLIIGTLVVGSQMNYFKNANLGYRQKAIVNISYPGDSISRAMVPFLESQLRAQAGIKELSFSRGMPVGTDYATDLQLETNHTKKADLGVCVKMVDTAYFNLYKLQFVAGRVYFPSDTAREFVVNETLLKQLNLGSPRDAIGKRIRLNGWLRPIVGVVKDFHFHSLRDPIDPLVMFPSKKAYTSVNIQLQATDIKPAMAILESIWNKDFPDYVIQYRFIDQTVANYYKQENQLSELFKLFSGIAIFISCLGLYGLIAFMAVRRNQEIGIRKVLGASVANIVYLLSKEFTMLIILAFVVACPIGYYFMNQWLQQYTFRIDLGIWFFLLTILLSLVIAWITVGYTAIKAARSNPVKSLRTD